MDALLGTGATGPARGDVLAAAERLAASALPVLALDGPTGLDLSSGEAHGPIRARVTVTFGGARRGHLVAREWCGRVIVVDIGFPPPDPAASVLVTDAWAGLRLPRLAAGDAQGRPRPRDGGGRGGRHDRRRPARGARRARGRGAAS